MSHTYVTKSGKKIVTDAYGNTTITKMQNGKQVTKTYNVGNVTAGTLIGDARHVKIGSSAIHVHGRPSETKLGAAPVNGAQRQQLAMHQVNNPAPPNAGGSNVRNQFNITGSVIGQMAVGNKGPTVFHNETKHFEAGSRNADYNISGGNFSQANIGGKAVYNNDKTRVGAFGSGGDGLGGGFSFDDLAYSDMEAEDKVLRILRKGISAEQLLQLLKKGHTVNVVEEALDKTDGVKITVDAMVESMLQTDEMDIEGDDD